MGRGEGDVDGSCERERSKCAWEEGGGKVVGCRQGRSPNGPRETIPGRIGPWDLRSGRGSSSRAFKVRYLPSWDATGRADVPVMRALFWCCAKSSSWWRLGLCRCMRREREVERR